MKVGNSNPRAALAARKKNFFNPFGGLLPPAATADRSVMGLYKNLGGTLDQLHKQWESLLNGPSVLEQLGGVPGVGGKSKNVAVPNLGLKLPALMNLGGLEEFTLPIAGRRVKK